MVRGAETSVRGAEASDSTGRQTDLCVFHATRWHSTEQKKADLHRPHRRSLAAPGDLGAVAPQCSHAFRGAAPSTASVGTRGASRDARRRMRRRRARNTAAATRTVTPSMTNAVDLGGDASDEGDRRRGARASGASSCCSTSSSRSSQSSRSSSSDSSRSHDSSSRASIVRSVKSSSSSSASSRGSARRGSAVAKDIVEGRANRRIPRLSSARASGARRGRPEGDEVSRRARE